MLGSDVPDPGMVNEGTKCGENKCRSADVLSYDCDVHTKCHGHGVCNSNRNCHCDYGWAPPSCELSGYGGSVDSGPTWNGIGQSQCKLFFFFFLAQKTETFCCVSTSGASKTCTRASCLTNQGSSNDTWMTPPPFYLSSNPSQRTQS
uniref:ADAM metallopeptidase domain 9a n=1 Tax=Haplochromis burtoni TaxID=8153 RepID=A0A3Q2WIY5_HAPBU